MNASGNKSMTMTVGREPTKAPHSIKNVGWLDGDWSMSGIWKSGPRTVICAVTILGRARGSTLGRRQDVRGGDPTDVGRGSEEVLRP